MRSAADIHNPSMVGRRPGQGELVFSALVVMQLEELPECYQTDEPFVTQDGMDELMVEGRGQRKRNVVSYNDGLDDDTWAMVSSEINLPSDQFLKAIC